MDTIYITNDPWRAQVAESAGINRVMVDLEIIGKIKRQGHIKTVISGHCMSDVASLRAVLNKALLMVRINPMGEHSRDEICASLDAGADVLMLPMFSSVSEVRAFTHHVSGRARTCLLLETGGALARLRDIVEIEGIDEIHIGLNDLHLALKLDFMFELVSGGLVDYIAQVVREKGIKLGIGGIARPGKGLLSPELIMSEHVRLGSSQVLLSRDFNAVFDGWSKNQALEGLRREISGLQELVRQLGGAGTDVLLANSRKLKCSVDEIVRASRASSETFLQVPVEVGQA